MNDIPLVSREGLIDENIGQQTERENQNAQVDPAEKQHKNEDSCHYIYLLYAGLEVDSASSQKNVTCVMNDEDHDPCGDLVAHHGEKDQTCSHEMMKHPLIVFFIVLFYYHQLEN